MPTRVDVSLAGLGGGTNEEGTPMLHISMLVARVVGQLKREEGAGLAEYALLLVLIAIACIVAVTALGSSIASVFTSISGSLN